MAIFSIQNSKLTPVKEKSIFLEKDIQKITESNLESVFRLQFVSSEFQIQNFRLDTLAFNKDNNAFVIIEYKRHKNFSVIDQGFAYLALMLNNKADFILEYNEKTQQNIKRDKIDWSQSRVLFLSQSFTSYQQNAINFKDLPIELWEVKIFSDNLILYNQIMAPEAKQSIKTITKNKTIENVSREVKVYTLQDHLNSLSTKTKSIFYDLREKILEISDEIQEKPQKSFIAYKNQKIFMEVRIQKEKIKITLDIPKNRLEDPRDMAKDMKNIGRSGTSTCEIYLNRTEDISYAISLIEQAIK